MNFKKICVFLILLNFFLPVSIYANEYDNSYEKFIHNSCQYNLNNNTIDTEDNYPAYITHHDCGRGGTGCDYCLDKVLSKECGCFSVTYKCCCGNVMHRFTEVCEKHR